MVVSAVIGAALWRPYYACDYGRIVDGLGKAVVLIASTAAIVVFGIILAAMSSLP